MFLYKFENYIYINLYLDIYVLMFPFVFCMQHYKNFWVGSECR